MIRSVFKALRAAWLWHRMYRLSVNGRYEDALWVARSAEDVARSRPYWQLFEIQQLGLLNNHVGALEQAKALIDDLSSRPNLSTDEKYFLTFARWYGQVAFRRLYSSETVPSSLEFDLGSFSLTDVSPRWKRAFPMTIHSEWEKDRSPPMR